MKIGQKIIRLDVVDSTNNYIANLIKQGSIDSGTVIMADEQFAGKGQRDAQWQSSAGENLTFSFFLDDVNLSVSRQFNLSQVVALSLYNFLNNLGLDAAIKWPNDIYIKGRKIAGVLIENQLKGSLIKSAIVGVGLNVNQTEFQGFSATSARLETGQSKLPHDLLFSFISAFNEQINELSQDKLHQKYLDKLYQFNVLASYEDVNGRFEGQIIDVLANGKLVMLKDGQEVFYDLKEITFL